MTKAAKLAAEIQRKVENFFTDARESIDSTGLDPRKRVDLAEMAAVMISVAPGVEFRKPESAAVVKGVILATLDFADKVRRESVQ